MWWANYIAVKQELVETVLQDLPPASGAPDAGVDSAAAKAAWDAPCAAGWSAREARASGDAAGAGCALSYPTLPCHPKHFGGRGSRLRCPVRGLGWARARCAGSEIPGAFCKCFGWDMGCWHGAASLFLTLQSNFLPVKQSVRSRTPADLGCQSQTCARTKVREGRAWGHRAAPRVWRDAAARRHAAAARVAGPAGARRALCIPPVTPRSPRTSFCKFTTMNYSSKL